MKAEKGLLQHCETEKGWNCSIVTLVEPQTDSVEELRLLYHQR